MKFTDEQLSEIINEVLTWHHSQFYKRSELRRKIESILTPPVQDGGGAEQFLTSRIDNEATSEDVARVMNQYAQLRTASLAAELEEAKREIERLKEDSVKESTWPVCDVEGCNQKSVSGGNCWGENGYWSVC